jgi:hypothetical protein
MGLSIIRETYCLKNNPALRLGNTRRIRLKLLP